MKEARRAYVPRDRLLAVVAGEELPATAAGSVLFADISGFTPLTEAYEKHLGSRKGGEELTRVLNEVYASLIGEVDRLAGSVIGFAGDAITCWFAGDDGQRAVGSALAMQAGMERFKAVPSPDGGTIALGLKAAVTSGTVKRFVVGDPAIQKVDILAGDPVYRVAHAEQLANRGEVVVDRPTRLALGWRLQVLEERADPGGGEPVYVAGSVTPPGTVAGWPWFHELEIPAGLIEPWILSAIRTRLKSGLSEFFTELRPATALFVKFEGIDFEGDTEADRKLDRFFAAVQHIVAEYDGITHQLTVGDKGSFLYSAFGAPVSHEDDTERAMAVALRLRGLADSLGFITAIRIGIGRGTTRVGAYGGPTRRCYGVLGDQVNLAARLMGKAAPGQILLSPAAAMDSRQAYRLRALEPIRVKGKSEPVAVQELLGVAERRGRTAAAYAIPMVGRGPELASLAGWIRQAGGGQGQAVAIVAETGLGKTRLVEAAISNALAAGFQLLHGECQSFGGNTPYTPWWNIWREFFGLGSDESLQEAERQLGDELRRINPELVARLPVLGPVLNLPFKDTELTRTFDAKLRRASLDSLLMECLRIRSASRPLLIVLEDAQAIDGVSRELLQAVVQAIARLPVLVLVAHRPVDAHAVLGPHEEALDHCHRLELREFTAAESAELITLKCAQLFGRLGAVPQPVLDHITARTGGNPFFIEEVMNWMAHRRIDILSVQALDSAELPVSLHALVLSRMDQLDEKPRITLKVASVIGRLFRAAVLWGIYPELGGEASVRAALQVLAQRDFAEPQEDAAELVYLFKHVVIHEVAYESLPHSLRQRIHEAIGAFIESHYPAESTQVLDLLAFHYGRSTNTAKQREYFVRAGNAAKNAYAGSAAIGYYQAALPLLDQAASIPVLHNLGKVLETVGDWTRAMQVYQEGLRLAEALGHHADAATSKLDIGDLHRRTGAMEEAARWLAESLADFEQLQHQPGIGQALHSAGTLAAQTGKLDQARDLYTRSLAIREQLGDELMMASLISNIGIILRFQGDLDGARQHYEESLRIREKYKDPFYLAVSHINLGLVRKFKGDYPGARADLERGLKLFQQVGDRAEIANALNSLAELALDQQDHAACERYLQEGLRLTREIGNRRGLAFILEAFASNAFFTRQPERCLRLFGAADALRHAIGSPLPDKDAARIEEIIDLAGQALHGPDPAALLAEGRTRPLPVMLDYASGLNLPED